MKSGGWFGARSYKTLQDTERTLKFIQRVWEAIGEFWTKECYNKIYVLKGYIWLLCRAGINGKCLKTIFLLLMNITFFFNLILWLIELLYILILNHLCIPGVDCTNYTGHHMQLTLSCNYFPWGIYINEGGCFSKLCEEVGRNWGCCF